MNKKQIKHFSLIIVLLSQLNISYSAQNKNVEIFNKFNELMDILESNFEKKQYKNACTTSTKIKNYIQKNYDALEKHQPYYSWKELIELMNALPPQLCRS